MKYNCDDTTEINRMKYSVPVSLFYTVFGSKIGAPGHFVLDLTMALKYNRHPS